MKPQLHNLCKHLEQGLIERAEVVRLALLAALSGEHILLIGKPGTAKSLLARRLQYAFSDSVYFERMLTRFSVPEELFGPLSIRALEQDRYHRLTASYLPEANIAFIDEIFKANSAILNALLTLLNEREFDNGAERYAVPLISVIAASNELPEDESLEALYDRFLLRYHIEPISDQNFDALIDLDSGKESDQMTYTALTRDDIESIQSAAASMTISDAVRALLHELRQFMQEKGVYISDRRWQQSIKLLRVSALTNQQDEVSLWDCLLLSHVLWTEPEHHAEIRHWLYQYLQLDIESALQRFERLVKTWEDKLEEDSGKHTQRRNEKGQSLYLSPEGETTTQHERVTLAERDGETLFLAPPDQEDRTNHGKGYTLNELEQQFFDASFKQTHIDGRWVDVQNYINNTQNRLVDRIDFTPLVDAFHFKPEYVAQQKAEISLVLDELSVIAGHYQSLEQQLQSIIDEHLWLDSLDLRKRLHQLSDAQPLLQNLQLRLQVCLQQNGELKVTPSETASTA